MSVSKKIKSLDQKFSWSFFGVLLALIIAAVSFYISYLENKALSIAFEILSNTRVLDVREEVGQLDISYKGQSIKKQEQTISIISLKIVNNSNKSVSFPVK